MVRGLLALEDSQAATARRIFAWQGLSLRDAMPLRIAGGIHNLLLTGAEPRLADIYEGRTVDQGQVDSLIREVRAATVASETQGKSTITRCSPGWTIRPRPMRRDDQPR